MHVGLPHASLCTAMSPSVSGYFSRLWFLFLSVFSLRLFRRHESLPELPTSTLDPTTPTLAPDGHISAFWEEAKQHWMQHPNVRRASVVREDRRKKRPRTAALPSHEIRIYVQDWSSLELDMTEFLEPHGGPPAATTTDESTVLLSQPPDHPTKDDDLTNPGDLSESSVLPSNDPNAPIELTASNNVQADLDGLPKSSDFNNNVQAGSSVREEGNAIAEPPSSSLPANFSRPYEANALSAVSGPLWDPPSFLVSPHSTPVPLTALSTTPKKVKARAKSTLNKRAIEIVPYPDVFSFSVYFSRDSVYTGGLPSLTFGVYESCSEPDLRRPISIYDVTNERNRYRSAAYSSCLFPPSGTSSPKRTPLVSTLNRNVGSEIDKDKEAAFEEGASESSIDGIADQFLAACDEISRCEWTENEFLQMFAP